MFVAKLRAWSEKTKVMTTPNSEVTFQARISVGLLNFKTKGSSKNIKLV